MREICAALEKKSLGIRRAARNGFPYATRRNFPPTPRRRVPGGKHQQTPRYIPMIRTLQIAALGLALSATSVLAADDPMVGGHEMFANKNIIENASQSDDHTTLVAAVKAAGLVEDSRRQGAVHGFCADQRGVCKPLPAGTVDTLLKPENKARR